MPGYTLLTVIAVIAVVVLELAVLRTGIFRTAQYWCAMVIVFAFQIPVDGWLTKLSDPIVIYNESQTSGVRFPWDIPVEDFGFGFAMVTLTILVWRRVIDGKQDRTKQDRRQDHRDQVQGKQAAGETTRRQQTVEEDGR